MIITHQIISTLSTLLAFTTFIGSTWGIRVDWNTNTGPIVPPTSTIPPVPQRPYREPAPAWEDQSNDIPNPNPYVYVLPPPSRPRYNNTNYLQRSTESPTQPPNYGTILSPHHNEISRDDQIVKPVAHLAVQFVPNVGYKYYAVIAYNPYMKHSRSIYDKPNGKYNAKLKKYKAYEEKAKFAPYLMYIPVPPPQQQQVPPYGFVSQKAQVSKS